MRDEQSLNEQLGTAGQEGRRKSGNPTEQEMAKFANSLSMCMGENENNVQNELFCNRLGDTPCCGRKLHLKNTFLGRTYIMAFSSYT